MVATVLGLWNEALSEIGARATVASLTEVSREAQVLQIHYDSVRISMLRAAPWNCARMQAPLEVLESYLADPPSNQAPWNFSYEYPEDCLMVRYLLPPLSSVTPVQNFPSRSNRFLPALSNDGSERVILANLADATAVYTNDLSDITLWDQGLYDAVCAALCAKICIPLTGNVQMKGSFESFAQRTINEVRAQDGNEAKPTTDHTPDWLVARGYNCDATPYFGGFWYTPYDKLAWGE